MWGICWRGEWDIAVQLERGAPVTEWNRYSFLTEEELVSLRGRSGVDSGTWAVRGRVYDIRR